LKVIGKTEVHETKNSAMIRFYLTNGVADYRFVLWQDHFANNEIGHCLRIGNVGPYWVIIAYSFI
jgi:hypothetical protein